MGVSPLSRFGVAPPALSLPWAGVQVTKMRRFGWPWPALSGRFGGHLQAWVMARLPCWAEYRRLGYFLNAAGRPKIIHLYSPEVAADIAW